jgi:hypothetical protein
MYFLETSDWNRINNIEGWLAFEAADISYSLIRQQLQHGLAADLLELGVHRAKYLSALYLAGRDAAMSVVGIDAFFQQGGVPMGDEFAVTAELLMRENVRSVAGDDAKLKIIRADSMKLESAALRKEIGAEFSFISIDAGHEAENVVNDFRLLTPLLRDGGVIAADDVYNFAIPGVAEGFFHYFTKFGEGSLAPFAYCGNKLFLCKPSYHAFYLAFVKEFASKRAAMDYCRNTIGRSEGNKDQGFTPKLLGYEILPFVW